MKSRIKQMAMQVLALFLVLSVAHAQVTEYDRASYSQPELEQMLAPIALYPDALLSHTLMAATYPTEVVEAAYWLRAHPGIQGEAAIRATENMQWDISVKSLLPFPHLLNTMESRYDWTQNLGNAFLGQQAQVMDTIQVLRHRAMAAGYLHSDTRLSVTQEGSLISIMPTHSTLVYLPYYNPRVVYGHWPQPGYAPVYWAPWPGYSVHSHYAGWTWQPAATIVSVGVLFAIFDWHHYHVYQRPHVSYWRHHPHYVYHKYSGPQHPWRHDPRHRREIPYHHAKVEQRYGHAARAYNQKTSHPTTREVRAGKRTPQAVNRPHSARSVEERQHNQRRPAYASRQRAPIASHPVSPQKRHVAPATARQYENGNHGTRPAAAQKEHREADASRTRHAASSSRDDDRRQGSGTHEERRRRD